MSYAKAAQAYQRNAVMTASPEKIVQMLYDAAIRHLEQSREALANPATTHSARVGVSLGKALSIISELRSVLDYEKGGAIAENLGTLYEFSIEQLTQANLTRSPEHIDPPLRVMRTLKEGWDGIIPN